MRSFLLLLALVSAVVVSGAPAGSRRSRASAGRSSSRAATPKPVPAKETAEDVKPTKPTPTPTPAPPAVEPEEEYEQDDQIEICANVGSSSRKALEWQLDLDTEQAYARGEHGPVVKWLTERMWTEFPLYRIKRVRRVLDAPDSNVAENAYLDLHVGSEHRKGQADKDELCLKIDFKSTSSVRECDRPDHGGCDAAHMTRCLKEEAGYSAHLTGYECACFDGFTPTAELEECQALSRSMRRERDFDVESYARTSRCFARSSCQPIEWCSVGSSEKCRCGEHSSCSTDDVPDGAYRCTCSPGYEHPEDGQTHTLVLPSGEHKVQLQCVDIDECKMSNPCGAKQDGLADGSNCHNLDGGYRCDCPFGTEPVHGADRGFLGCRDVDECKHPERAGAFPCFDEKSCVNLNAAKGEYDEFEVQGEKHKVGFRCGCPEEGGLFLATGAKGHGDVGCCVATDLSLVMRAPSAIQYGPIQSVDYRVCKKDDALARKQDCDSQDLMTYIDVKTDIRGHLDGFAVKDNGGKVVHLIGRDYGLHSSFSYQKCSAGGKPEVQKETVDAIYSVKPLNECKPDDNVPEQFHNKCAPNARCEDTARGYTCHCPDGYSGNGFAGIPDYEVGTPEGIHKPYTNWAPASPSLPAGCKDGTPPELTLLDGLWLQDDCNKPATANVASAGSTSTVGTTDAAALIFAAPHLSAADAVDLEALLCQDPHRTGGTSRCAFATDAHDGPEHPPSVSVQATILSASEREAVVRYSYTATDAGGNEARAERIARFVNPCDEHAVPVQVGNRVECRCREDQGWSNQGVDESGSNLRWLDGVASHVPGKICSKHSSHANNTALLLDYHQCRDVEPPVVTFLGTNDQGRETCVCESMHELQENGTDSSAPESLDVWCSNPANQPTEPWSYWRFCIRAKDNGPSPPYPVSWGKTSDTEVGPVQEDWELVPGETEVYRLTVTFSDAAGNKATATTRFHSSRVDVLQRIKQIVDEQAASSRRWLTVLTSIVSLIVFYGIAANLGDVRDAILLCLDAKTHDGDYEAFRRGYDLLLWIVNPCARPSERSRTIDRYWNERDG